MSNSDMPIPENTVKRIVAMGINVAEIFFIVFIAVQFCVFMYKSFQDIKILQQEQLFLKFKHNALVIKLVSSSKIINFQHPYVFEGV